MGGMIALAIFYTAAIFIVVWFGGGLINYQRYIPAKARRDAFMLWFMVGPVGPMLFAYQGWEARHKLHGPVLDSVSDAITALARRRR